MPTTQQREQRAVSSVRFPIYEYLALFTPVALLILVIGFSIAYYRTETQIQAIIDEDSIRLHQVSGFVGAQMSASFNHLLSLYQESSTQDAVNGSPGGIVALQQSLLTLARRNPLYDQIRWLDINGVEQLRISRAADGPFVTPAEQLQDKSERYYFQAANMILPGDIYVSRIDLNVENGQLETPPKPMLRIATPIANQLGQRQGVLLINILLTEIFDSVHMLEKQDVTANYLLVNQQGELLSGSMRKPGKMADTTLEQLSFAKRFPERWKAITAADAGHLMLTDELLTWKTITSFENLIGFQSRLPAEKAGFERLISGDFSLVLLAHRPLDYLLDMRRDIRVPTMLGVILTLLVYGAALYFYMNGHFRAQRAELEATYARAHASNMSRLKELEERFRRLVNSSSVGQLVINNDGVIEISNPTVEKLLGYTQEELVGAAIESLVPMQYRKAHHQHRDTFLRDPKPRKMGEGRRLEALRKDGSTVSVEVGLNPYTDRGRQLVLVNVIDVT